MQRGERAGGTGGVCFFLHISSFDRDSAIDRAHELENFLRQVNRYIEVSLQLLTSFIDLGRSSITSKELAVRPANHHSTY